MKVKTSLSLDGHVEVAQMIASGGQADEAGDEEGVALNKLPAWIAVDNDTSQYKPWKWKKVSHK